MSSPYVLTIRLDEQEHFGLSGEYRDGNRKAFVLGMTVEQAIRIVAELSDKLDRYGEEVANGLLA